MRTSLDHTQVKDVLSTSEAARTVSVFKNTTDFCFFKNLKEYVALIFLQVIISLMLLFEFPFKKNRNVRQL